MTDPRRAIPAVGALLALPGVKALTATVPAPVLADAVRAAVDAVRREPQQTPPDEAAWVAAITHALARRQTPSLRPVFNVTGVVLHTNLGRAPLARAALDAINRTAGGGSSLEFDLESGERGSRYVHCAGLLRELTGAADALVVNNGAAALVLALNTLADGKEAIVSRGELIEIGGSFRVPDIMARSGATLREVGTTNRTHLEDYRRVVGDRTGAIVKVHRSNFEVRGFVAEASVAALALLAREARIPLLLDLGSGLLVSLQRFGLLGEPTVRDAVRDGATLVVMSGDKLLGGPQAGILVGSAAAIDACRRNPLTRALRVDKLTLAALAATLALYRDPERAFTEVPVLRMLAATPEAIRSRCARLADALRGAGVPCEVADSEGAVGGGAFPTARLASAAVVIGGDAVRVAARLRAAPTPVIGRIEDGRVRLDLRSLPDEFDQALATAVMDALARA